MAETIWVQPPWEYEIITKDTMLINLSPQFKTYVQKSIWKVSVSQQYFWRIKIRFRNSEIKIKNRKLIRLLIIAIGPVKTVHLKCFFGPFSNFSRKSSRHNSYHIIWFIYVKFDFTLTQQIWAFSNMIFWLIIVWNNNYQ